MRSWTKHRTLANQNHRQWSWLNTHLQNILCLIVRDTTLKVRRPALFGVEIIFTPLFTEMRCQKLILLLCLNFPFCAFVLSHELPKIGHDHYSFKVLKEAVNDDSSLMSDDVERLLSKLHFWNCSDSGEMKDYRKVKSTFPSSVKPGAKTTLKVFDLTFNMVKSIDRSESKLWNNLLCHKKLAFARKRYG